MELEETYLPSAAYRELVESLVELADPRRLIFSDLRTAIVFALGEVGGIFPDDVREQTNKIYVDAIASE